MHFACWNLAWSAFLDTSLEVSLFISSCNLIIANCSQTQASVGCWPDAKTLEPLRQWFANILISLPLSRAGLKGRGPGEIFTGGPLWRNSWRYHLQKLCFRWFARFSFVFSGSQKYAYANAHTVNCEKQILECIFTKKKYFTCQRVARQETTYTRTTSRNQRLQTKTLEKEHANMVSQAECERCFQANVLIFNFISRNSG